MLALLLLLQSGVPDPPTYDGWKKQLAVTLPRIEADPRVDGMLDEPVWRRAARLVGFSQYRPVDGRPAEDSTEVLVWYAPDAIWFGVRAYEPHGNVVRATLADVGQVTVNERFALFYPEKRPFFLDGLEQFDTPNRLIYTRQIVQPVAGAKLTGKLGGTAVAYLGAVDDHTQSAAGSNPVYNLLRLRRDLGASSTAGLVYTDRIDGGDYHR